MYFEERLLQPYAETLKAEQLEEGDVYFDAGFLDRQMLLPSMESYVFIGSKLDSEREAGLYFQDFASHSSGIRHQTATEADGAIFLIDSEEELHLFDYEGALDQILWCSLRRQGLTESEPRLFKGRHLGSQAEPTSPESLQEGSLYFSLVFRDDKRLIPALEPYILLGKDLRSDDRGRFYFQDFSSHRRGVRFESDTKIDQAQFVIEDKAEANYFFDFEHALEELMRCSLRRRKEGLRIAPRLPKADGTTEGAPDVPRLRSVRFEDPELQQRLIAELRNNCVTFELREDNAVVYANSDTRAVGHIASRIQDSHFRGYFLFWGENLEAAHLFREKLKELGLPFLIEYQDDKLIFFLPKGSEELHHQIVEGVYKSG